MEKEVLGDMVMQQVRMGRDIIVYMQESLTPIELFLRASRETMGERFGLSMISRETMASTSISPIGTLRNFSSGYYHILF
ncbi:hypothetical protein ES708_11843 [subsurface metagenome]